MEEYRFSELFNLYRLKSNLRTYSELGALLAEEGYVYEDSIFSKWKSGERVPRDRRLILALLRVFVKQGGVLCVDDANQLLFSLDQRGLKEDEVRLLKLANIARNPLHKYSQLFEPNTLFYHFVPTHDNIRILVVENLQSKVVREFWKHQAFCAIAEYHVKFSQGKVSPEEVYSALAFDEFEKSNQCTTLVAVCTDPKDGHEYLAGTLRIVKGMNHVDFPIEVSVLYESDLWPHSKLGLENSQIGELSRLVIPDWSKHLGTHILQNMQQVAYQEASQMGVKLLYVSITEALAEFVKSLGIEIIFVQNSILRNTQTNDENALKKYPIINYYSKLWKQYVFALCLFPRFDRGMNFRT